MLTRRTRPALIVALTAALFAAPPPSARAGGVGDPQVKTDHPYYQGELAYSTLDRLVRSALATDWGLGLKDSTRDLALKLWLWRITHTIHDYSPQGHSPIYAVLRAKYGDNHTPEHPVRPDPKLESYIADAADSDLLRWQFSYGYGLCGTLHATMTPLVRALAEITGQDYRSRAVTIPGDNNHELYYDNRWHLFDVNMGGLVFDGNDPATARLVSFQDLFGPKGGPKHADLLDNAPRFNGCFLPVWTWAPNQDGYTQDYFYLKKIIDDPNHYWDDDRAGHRQHGEVLYAQAYQACPIRYHLKRGESFTRWFAPTGLKDQLKAPHYLWWGANLPGGPGSGRWWGHYLKDDTSLVADAPFGKLQFSTEKPTDNKFARHDPKKVNHSNGLFRWQPDLARGGHLDGLVQADPAVHHRADSPRLYADQPAKLVLGFFSPYAIAAMPPDDTDPAKPGATLGAILSADAVGSVPVEVSTNCGATWLRIGTLAGNNASLDFTDQVKGHNQYWLRFGLSANQGLDRLLLQTAVVICPAVYPKLKSGGTTVTYRSGNTGVVEVTPDCATESAARFDGYFVAAENMTFSGYSSPDLVAWKLDPGTGSCTYKVSAPPGRTLREVTAAAAVRLTAPARAGTWAKLHVATSASGPWELIGEYDPVRLKCVGINEASRVWLYGQADVADANVSTAYVKLQLCNADQPGGLRFLHIFGTYDVPQPDPLDVTFHWTEAGQPKSHRLRVPAGTTEQTFGIPTGQDVANEKVVFAVATD